MKKEFKDKLIENPEKELPWQRLLKVYTENISCLIPRPFLWGKEKGIGLGSDIQ